MSVPIHQSSCKSWTFPASCWDCGDQIFIFGCTCGSSVRFNRLGDPWPQHYCGSAPLPEGWEVIKKLQIMGVEIDQTVLDYACVTQKTKKQERTPIVKIEPLHGATLDLILILRERQSATYIMKEIQGLGDIGLKMFGLDKSDGLVQLTLHDTSDEQSSSYTCLIPGVLQPSKSDIGKLFGITIKGYQHGSLKFWLASGIADLGSA